MKKQLSFLAFLCLISISSFAQYDNNWALGFRVGEPLGVNVRKYFDAGSKAFDVNIGTYGFLYGKNRDYGRGQNKGQYKSAGLMIQGIYSWVWSPGQNDRIHFTYGMGGQINNRSHYLNSLIGVREDNVKKLSLGPAAAAGIEVKLPNNDLSVFLDGGGYLEALPTPFFGNWQISGGVRLNIENLNSRSISPIRRNRSRNQM